MALLLDIFGFLAVVLRGSISLAAQSLTIGGIAFLVLVFPLRTALGGMSLLTHSHALSNVKEQLLVEIAHVPLALAGISAGWRRWLELRLNGTEARAAFWVSPIAFFVVGPILLICQEA